MSDAARARAVVLRHALDAADAVELLAMIGLDGDQCDERDAPGRWRRPAGVLPLSAATEARLAAVPTPPSPPPAPAPVPAARPAARQRRNACAARPPATKPAPASTTEERPCAGCDEPVVPQTRYRLDPADYRARGIRLLAAKGLCWPCYKQQQPQGSHVDTAPENLILPPCKDCGREMLAQKVWPVRPDLREGRARAGGYGMCNGCYSVARNAGTLPEPTPRKRLRVPEVTITPSYPVACAECGPLGAPRDRREAVRLRDGHVNEHRRARGGRPVEMAKQFAAAVDNKTQQHRHAWEWQPALVAVPLPCSCGEPSPAMERAG